jgi:hypothetical protein
MNGHTLMMAFWILRDNTPPIVTNIITTSHGTYILEVEECNNDDDDDDTDIHDERSEAPNDNDYHEPRPTSTISHLSRSRITRA